MPRIAIPIPTSFDPEYNRRNWAAYAAAVASAGGEPVEVAFDLTPQAIAKLASTCQAILLPGSGADVNALKFGQERDPAAAPPDPARENVDELLLQDAHNLHKPILGICFGMQTLNVWRGGTLVQDLAPLPVNHRARGVAIAHTALIAADSLLANLMDREEAATAVGFLRLGVNSSHHQALGIVGDGLRVVGRCPQDGVVEAIEGPLHADAPHFVLGVQWHPERTLDASATSRAIFARLVQEAATWRPRAVTASVLVG